MLFAHIKHNFDAAFYPRLSEWAAAAVTLVMGIVLTQNPDLMVTSLRGYQPMLVWMSQASWATVFMLLGFIRLMILLVNGAVKRSPWLRAGTAFVTCGIWSTLFASFFAVYGLGMVMAGGYMVMDYMNIVRAMRDARAVDDAIRGRPAYGRPVRAR